MSAHSEIEQPLTGLTAITNEDLPSTGDVEHP